jgi:hypothetical protein
MTGVARDVRICRGWRLSISTVCLWDLNRGFVTSSIAKLSIAKENATSAMQIPDGIIVHHDPVSSPPLFCAQ